MAHQESWNCDASEGTGCQASDGLSPCINNCGFLGCSATMNLCSQCYRQLVLNKDLILGPSSSLAPIKEQDETVRTPDNSQTTSLSANSPSRSNAVSDLMNISAVSSSLFVMPAACISAKGDDLTYSGGPLNVSLEADGPGAIHCSKKRTGNRCHSCKKRVGLLGFKCRCGDLFCAAHRYSDKHECPFDYKAAGRVAIAKANPVIKSEKVARL